MVIKLINCQDDLLQKNKKYKQIFKKKLFQNIITNLYQPNRCFILLSFGYQIRQKFSVISRRGFVNFVKILFWFCQKQSGFKIKLMKSKMYS